MLNILVYNYIYNLICLNVTRIQLTWHLFSKHNRINIPRKKEASNNFWIAASSRWSKLPLIHKSPHITIF